MSTTLLKIRPTITTEYRSGLSKLKKGLNDVGSASKRSLRATIRDTAKINANLTKGAHMAGVMARNSAAMGRSLMGLRTLLAGGAVAVAGKTFIEKTVGSSLELDKTRALLKSVVKEQHKVVEAERLAVELTKEVSSLSRSSAMEGMMNLYKLSGNDLNRAKSLVRTAKALESLAPEQGFEGAVFALKELQSGDTMSLRSRFNIRLPTRAEAQKAAKKAGKTLDKYYFDSITSYIDDVHGTEGDVGSGITELLRIDAQSFSGQVKMIGTAIDDVFLSIGDQAKGPAQEGIQALAKSIGDLAGDEQFRADMKEVGVFMGDMAKKGAELVRDLPNAYKEAKEFFKETGAFLEKHETAIKATGLALLAHKLTDGATTRVALKGAAGLARRLGGKVFGTAASTVLDSAAHAGVQKVFVVNMSGGAGGGLGGSGAGSFGQTNLGKAGMLSTGVAKLGVGGMATAVAAGVGIFGSFIYGAKTLYDVMNDTHRISKRYEDKYMESVKKKAEFEARVLKAREKTMAKEKAEADLMAKDPRHYNNKQLGRAVSSVGTYAMVGAGSKMRAGINQMFGGAGATFTGGAHQEHAVDKLNEELKKYGVQFAIKTGQKISEGTLQGGMGVLLAQNKDLAEKVQGIQEINSKYRNRDGSFKSDSARNEYNTMMGTEGGKRVMATANAIVARGDQAARLADKANANPAPKITVPKVAENFNFNFVLPAEFSAAEATRLAAQASQQETEAQFAKIIGDHTTKTGE